MKADLTEAGFRGLEAAPILLADRWKRSFSQMAPLEDISLSKAREHIMYTTYLDHSEVIVPYIGHACAYSFGLQMLCL